MFDMLKANYEKIYLRQIFLCACAEELEKKKCDDQNYGINGYYNGLSPIFKYKMNSLMYIYIIKFFVLKK